MYFASVFCALYSVLPLRVGALLRFYLLRYVTIAVISIEHFFSLSLCSGTFNLDIFITVFAGYCTYILLCDTCNFYLDLSILFMFFKTLRISIVFLYIHSNYCTLLKSTLTVLSKTRRYAIFQQMQR